MGPARMPGSGRRDVGLTGPDGTGSPLPYPRTVILVDAQGLAASRPGRPLYADVSLTLSSGDRLAVVGLNGCGKSTLLRQLAGRVEPEAGTVRRGRGTRVVMLDQDAPLPDGTVREAVGGGWEGEAVLDRLGLGDLLDVPVGELSGGQAKRVALARALAEVGAPGAAHDDAVLLILDEPTNHLDIDAIAWLEERLAAHRGGLVLVTHDRHVLDRVTTRIVELDRGDAHVHEGGYASYLEARAERAEREAQSEEVRRNLARRELAWLRRGAPARTRKPKFRVETATTSVEGQRQAAPGPASSTWRPRHASTPTPPGVRPATPPPPSGPATAPPAWATPWSSCTTSATATTAASGCSATSNVLLEPDRAARHRGAQRRRASRPCSTSSPGGSCPPRVAS